MGDEELTKAFKEDLEKVITSTFIDLRKLYEKRKNPSEGEQNTRIMFPRYNNTKSEDDNDEWRISEQEFRFVFVEKINEILKQKGYFYSIETPTIDKYKFSSKGDANKCPIAGEGQSASFDLTIKDCNGKNVALIEFKAHSASLHEIVKDLCKLFNNKEEGDLRYFINVFKTMSPRTEKSFKRKFSSNEDCWPNIPYANKEIACKKFDKHVVVIAEALDNESIIKKIQGDVVFQEIKDKNIWESIYAGD